MEMTEATKKVEFHVEKKGYSIGEVDEYIRILSHEYEQVLEELRTEKERHKDLVSGAEKEAISSLLIKAEIMAKEIKDNAEKEAREEREKIKEEIELLSRTRLKALADLQQLGDMIQQLTEQTKQLTEQTEQLTEQTV